jgi:cation transport ATPase
MSNVAETYRKASDDELAAFHADSDSLTDEARDALHAEINRRGLSDEQIASTNEARTREREEQRQTQLKTKRKSSVPWLLIFGQIVSILVVAAVATLGFLGLINTTPAQNEAAGGMFVYAVIFTLALCLTFFRGKVWPTVAIATAIDAALLVYLRFSAKA